jgi:hypothetical protein
MKIDNKFEIGQQVYIKTDKDQSTRIVTSIQIRPNNLLMYELGCGSQCSWHYDFEITEDQNVLISLLQN